LREREMEKGKGRVNDFGFFDDNIEGAIEGEIAEGTICCLPSNFSFWCMSLWHSMLMITGGVFNLNSSTDLTFVVLKNIIVQIWGLLYNLWCQNKSILQYKLDGNGYKDFTSF